MSDRKRRSLRFSVEPLEPRLLLSADWAAVLAPPWSEDAGSTVAAGDDLWLSADANREPDFTVPAPLDLMALGNLHAEQGRADRAELVVVDTAVEGFEQLVADITNRGDGVKYFVHLIETGTDGVASLSALLAGFDELAAVHIVSHGDAGGIQLGSTWLDSDNIGGYADAIGGWSSALADNADLLLYGCNLAATADGQHLAGTLAALTGADVAASSDETGQAALGGDWVFEHQVGSVHTAVAFSAMLQAQWNGVLAAFIVNSLDDTVDINPGDGVAEDASGNTSLRAAIMEANALPGADFIQLPSGHYDIAIPFGGGPADSHGDLDIRGDLTLVGAGADSTTIDGNNLHRVLDIDEDVTATISGVTIERGGDISTGGGIMVRDGATLTLYEAVVRDNNFDIINGAGIFNEGKLFLTDVTLAGNDAQINGGGLYNEGTAVLNRVTLYGNDADRGGGMFHAGGELTLSNVTVSSNSASNSGGGIYAQETTVILSSTVTNNAATSGGGVVKEPGSFSLQLGSSIIAGNSAFSSDDVSGDFASLGYNLIGDRSGSSNLTDGVNNDQVGSLLLPIDPMLGALQDNGGYVLTHALQPGSPAIDLGDPASPSAYDARVASRDAAPDIGSYELNGVVNATPTATNLDQAFIYTEDDGKVIIMPIVVREVDAGDIITATLTVADPATGVLTAGSGNGEVYTAGTGVWTVTGTVGTVNAALAAVSFTPAADNAQGTYITTTIRDASGHGPPTGLILLEATPVNDAPDVVLLGDQAVVENSGLHTMPGFALATPGGGPDEAAQTFTFLLGTTNAALFAVAPAIDASGTLTYTLNPGVTGTATVTVKVQDSGGVANGGTDTSPERTFDIAVLADGAGTSLLLSTRGNVMGAGASGIDSWFDSQVVAFGDPGLSFGADAATSGEFALQFRLEDFGDAMNVNGLHFVNSGLTVGTGAGDFDLQAGDLLLTFDGGGDRTYTGASTSITVQESDVFVFRPQAPGDYTAGEFYYLLDNPLNDNVQGVAIVESASVTIGDGPALVQGTFLLSERDPGEHDNIYTYRALNVGDGSTTSTLGRQLLVNAEGAGNLNFSDQIQGIHIIEQATIIGGMSFLPGDLLLTLDKDQDGAGAGVGDTRLQASQNDVFRLRLSETHQGPNGRATGVADMVFDGFSLGLTGDSEDLDALTLVNGSPNVAPNATNLNQVLNYTEDAAVVDLADIVVTDADSGDLVTVVLTLADTATGMLTAGSGNGETYDAITGVWKVSGTTAQVNAALAAIAFVPATDNAVNTTIATQVKDFGGLGPADGVINLNVTPVNDAPTFTLGANQTVLEDSGPHSVIGFASAQPGGGSDEAGQNLLFTVLNDNPGLFLVAPTIDASGTLTYTLNPNVNGTARVTVTVTDSGGTANGGVDTSPAQVFDVVVTPVNDAPLLMAGGDQAVLEDSGFHAVTGFASALPGGGADEAGQTLIYTVTPDNAALFAVGPAIDASGTLTYTLNPNVNGTARITVTVTDSGGTANGGVDTSPSQVFDIVVTPVNDAPLLVTGGDQAVLEDSGFHAVTGFASALPGGGPDEAGQTLIYTVTPDNAALFAVGPAIDASGTLTYTLNPNVNGTARVTVTVTDSGGTANGGVDTSPSQFFDIVVTPVNDAPTLVIGGDQMVLEGNGFHSLVAFGFASALPGGGADEAGQTLIYSVTPDNPALFAVGPAIDASGTLTYTLNPNVNGTARIAVTVTDSGGTASGGVDTSAAQFFDIVVNALPATATAVNLDQTMVYLEDSGRVEFDDIAIAGLANSAVVTATLTLADTATGQLSAASGNGETYDPTTGIWQVSGTVGQVNAALSDVGFVAATDNARSTSVAVAISYPPGNPPAAGVIRLDAIAVNDAPALVLLGDQVLLEDAGSQQVAVFATAMAGGGADEAGQTFTYRVDTDNPALFSIAPAIDSNGMLSYTLAENVSGSALLTVTLTDSGGLAAGGQNAAPVQAVRLDVLPVNDAPAGSDATVTALDNTPFVFSPGAFGFSDAVDSDDFAAIQVIFIPEGAGTLFHNGRAVLPGEVIDVATIAAGGLTFLPQNGVGGNSSGLTSAAASFGFRVQDTGGTALGGADTDPQVRRISINLLVSGEVGPESAADAVNDTPAVEEVRADAPAPAVQAEAEATESLPKPEQQNAVAVAPLVDARVAGIQPVEVLAEQTVPAVQQFQSNTITLRDAASGERAAERTIAAVPEVVEWEAELALEADVPGRQVYFVAESTGAKNLDLVRDDIREEIGEMRFEVGQTASAVVGLSVGYVSWLLRGGVLLSSMLSAVPTWRFIDPLPVFSSVGRTDDDVDDESLESIVQSGPHEQSQAVVPAAATSHSDFSKTATDECAGDEQRGTGEPT